jgi:putative ABC transport system permease protein
VNDRKKRGILPHARPGEQEAVDVEVLHHLMELVDRLMADGWTKEDAQNEAVRRFGDLERIRQEVLESRGSRSRWAERARESWGKLSELGRDARYAARVLLRRPAFTLTAVLTLAVAIGGNAAIFSVVNATLLRPLPFPDGNRLMRAYIVIPAPGTPEGMRNITWSYPKYELLRDRQQVFDQTTVFRAWPFTITGEEDPERIDAEIVGHEYLPMLGVSPVLGRAFLPEENASPDTHYVALLGHDLWVRRYARDPGMVGRRVVLNDRAYEVVGVLPEGFGGLTGGADIWVPTMTISEQSLMSPGSHNQHVLAHLAPGVTVERAKRAVEDIGRQVEEVWPAGQGRLPWGAGAVTLQEERMEPVVRASILFLFGAVGFVLLIACVNVANLLLARASAREREVAIRKAMGAGRGRIVRQLMVESGLVAMAGAALGLVLAVGGVQVLKELAPVVTHASVFRGAMAGLTDMGLSTIRFDGSVLLFGMAVAVASVFLFGLAPALYGTRGDLTVALRDGARGASRRRLAGGLLSQRSLVVAELALTFALLVGSGLMIRSMGLLLADDGGFRAEGVVAARVSIPRSRYEDAEAVSAFYRALDDRLEALPGVENVGMNICLPLSRSCNGTNVRFLDGPAAGGEEDVNVGIHWIDHDYFRTLRIPLVRGRAFTEADRDGAPGVLLVSQAAADQYWPGADPLESRVLVGGDSLTVVGVVGDVHYESPEEEPLPQIYLAAEQHTARGRYVILKSGGDPSALIPGVRGALRELDPTLPLVDAGTMEDRVADATSRPRFNTNVLTVFGLVALILAAIGVYGVVAFGVAERTHEIGVRVAIGAERVDVLKMVLARGAWLALLGVGLGSGLVVALMRVLRSVLYGVEPFDPWTLTVTASVLLAVALLASYLPARRAVRVDPLTALRAE